MSNSESSFDSSGSQNDGDFSEQYLDRFKNWEEINKINTLTKNAIKRVESSVLENVARTGEHATRPDGTKIKIQAGKFFCRTPDQNHISHFDCVFCPVIPCDDQPHINAITCKKHMKEHNETWQKLMYAPTYSREASFSPEPPESPIYNEFSYSPPILSLPKDGEIEIRFNEMGDADNETNSYPQEACNFKYNKDFNVEDVASPIPSNNKIRRVDANNTFQDNHHKLKNKKPAPPAYSRPAPAKKHKLSFINNI